MNDVKKKELLVLKYESHLDHLTRIIDTMPYARLYRDYNTFATIKTMELKTDKRIRALTKLHYVDSTYLQLLAASVHIDFKEYYINLFYEAFENGDFNDILLLMKQDMKCPPLSFHSLPDDFFDDNYVMPNLSKRLACIGDIEEDINLLCTEILFSKFVHLNSIFDNIPWCFDRNFKIIRLRSRFQTIKYNLKNHGLNLKKWQSLKVSHIN